MTRFTEVKYVERCKRTSFIQSVLPDAFDFLTFDCLNELEIKVHSNSVENTRLIYEPHFYVYDGKLMNNQFGRPINN